jgi:hypothetical protein
VYVVVQAVKRFKIPREAFSSNLIEKLSKGAEVGILFRDDGQALIREISPALRDYSAVVNVPTTHDKIEF